MKTKPTDIFMEVLREAREKRGLSRKQIFQSTGIPEHSLKAWEMRERNPRLPSIIKLVGAVGFRLELVPTGSRRAGAGYVN